MGRAGLDVAVAALVPGFCSNNGVSPQRARASGCQVVLAQGLAA
ncbi:MAG: hypothetical protein ACPIOQ_32170 [Promethearchaeia archaeon]